MPPSPRAIQTKYPVAVWGHGPVPCPYMVVGEAPGRNEIEQGIPFCGRSGDLLNEALEYAGVARENVYVTNAYKGDVGSGNRNPTDAEVLDHRPYLDDELARVEPSGILLVGTIAAKAFGIEFTRLGDIVGKRLGYTDKIQVYPTYHPAYILRGGYDREEFRFDVARFVLTTGVLYGCRKDGKISDQGFRTEGTVPIWNGARYH